MKEHPYSMGSAHPCNDDTSKEQTYGVIESEVAYGIFAIYRYFLHQIPEGTQNLAADRIKFGC